MWDPYNEFESTVLPNGLTVYASHWKERPWEAIGFIAHSGAEQDPVGLEGLSHFVEHLISENASIPQKDISAFFEDCGGSVNFGLTSQKCAYYHFFAPNDREVLARAFSLFGHMLFFEKMEKFLERERRVIIGEFHQYFPIKFNFDLEMRERRALYAGYWLERFATPIGTPDSVKQITQSDIQKYYDSHYTPANISVVGVGGMNLAGLVNLLSESPFSADKRGSRTPLPLRAKSIKPPLENRHIFEFSEHISMTTPIKNGFYRSVVVIPGKVNTSIRILGYMLNEILDDEVRQSRAWTYDIGCAWCDFRHFHEFAINCGALDLSGIEGIEDVVEVCIASLADREDLFEQAKRRAIAGGFMNDPSGRNVRNNAIDDLADCYRIISLTEQTKEFEELQMSDIRDALKWISPERRWTLIKKP